jgi:hypothetical protein
MVNGKKPSFRFLAVVSGGVKMYQNWRFEIVP